jgi:hypothetical protein
LAVTLEILAQQARKLGLADAVGASLGVLGFQVPNRTSDGHFPAGVSREYWDQLLKLAASATLDTATWAALGPHFFHGRACG